ncbi:hypothetical protein ABH940_004100 [Streptacidiphilus sp. BW17]
MARQKRSGEANGQKIIYCFGHMPKRFAYAQLSPVNPAERDNRGRWDDS